jgi:hypothetical protein
MSEPIKFTYKGTDYKLEFTRKSIKLMEKTGFKFNDEAIAKPVTFCEDLFRGAFFANHKNVMLKTIEEIYESIANKGALRDRLMEMFTETMNALYDDDVTTETENTENFILWE